MPGGFCRISESLDARAFSIQRGDRSADVWVLADSDVVSTTLLPSPDNVRIRRSSGTLPSRAADNLFWLGRYLERAEATLRLVRALVGRLAETEAAQSPLVTRLLTLLSAWGAMPRDLARGTPGRYAMAALTRHDLPGALPQVVKSARAAASVIATASRPMRGARWWTLRPAWTRPSPPRPRKRMPMSGPIPRCASSPPSLALPART